MMMVAKKPLHYDGLKYWPGDSFYCNSEKHAKIFQILKKAEPFEEKVATYQRRDMTAKVVPSDGLQDARAQYEAKFGKKPYWGWSSETLYEKISEVEPTE